MRLSCLGLLIACNADSDVSDAGGPSDAADVPPSGDVRPTEDAVMLDGETDTGEPSGPVCGEAALEQVTGRVNGLSVEFPEHGLSVLMDPLWAVENDTSLLIWFDELGNEGSPTNRVLDSVRVVSIWDDRGCQEGEAVSFSASERSDMGNWIDGFQASVPSRFGVLLEFEVSAEVEYAAFEADCCF